MKQENTTHNFEQDFEQLLLAVLSKAQLSYDRSFSENGGNSLSVLFFVAEIKTRYDFDMPVEFVFSCKTIAKLREFICSALGSMPGNKPVNIAGNGEDVKALQQDIPLLPNRYRYFFQRKTNLHYWNVDTPVLKLSVSLTEQSLSHVVEALLNAHPVLTMQLQKSESGWRQFLTTPEAEAVIDYLEIPPRAQISDVKARVDAKMAQMQSGFEFPGTLFKVLYIKGQDSQPYVYLLMHHLLVDGYSFKLIVKDFLSLCQQMSKGASVDLPKEHLSYPQYVELYLKHMKENERDYFDYWQRQKLDNRVDIPLKGAFDPRLNLDQYNLQVIDELSVDLASQEKGNDFALCLFRAIAKAYKNWTQSRQLFMDVAYHGRDLPGEGINLFRTAGWVSEAVPFHIPLSDNHLLERSIAEQMKTTGSYGCGFGYLKHISDNKSIRQAMQALASPDISFNYVAGKIQNYGADGVATTADEFDRFSVKPPQTQRCYLISGGGWFEQDKFILAWDFSDKLLCKKSVTKFTSLCIDALKQELALLS